MERQPNFRRLGNGKLAFGYTPEARAISEAMKKSTPPPCLPANVVTRRAVDEVRRQLGEDGVADSICVLGQHRLQFGVYHDQTFQWIVENDMGYAAWLVDSLHSEKETGTPLSKNKFAFKEYVLSFAEGREAVVMKEGEQLKKRKSPQEPQHKVVLLPDGWKQSLPEADHAWISQALFKPSKKNKAELAWERVDRLWWYPPQPALIPSQLPHADCYFSQRLLLWMPRKLWNVCLTCPNASCADHQLTSASIYPRVRQVLDLDGYYNLAAEYLECHNCKGKLISWSGAIIKQLEMGHRLQFPALLTYRYACDIKVTRLLPQRALGNSASQLLCELAVEHEEKYGQKLLHYLSDCKMFTDANKQKLLSQPDVLEPPQMPSIPGCKWLLRVYGNDVMRRIDEMKASITSVFGSVLKIDSTKKVVKKLAGHSTETASWATNVSNEYGQVLISVLTTSEGYGLGPMISGIVCRYREAHVKPPQLLYVDRDCCGNRHSLQQMFTDWPELNIRLDIWHFMRRFTDGCTSESHQIHGIFMSRLSACIFKWSNEDVSRLMEAKRAELHLPQDANVTTRITGTEMALHCRRKTRGVEETTTLIERLLETLSGEQGNDILGVPLLDRDRMLDIWKSQKRHVACIQDPDGFALYTETGQLKKGGVSLPVFRCARGSTSLESFHLYLNRFIPGTCASGMHFQAYLLEGLARWNEDRRVAPVCVDSTKVRIPQPYSRLVKQLTNKLGCAGLGRAVCPSFQEPCKYTGELIGVEYLYSQTGEVLQDFTLDPDSEDSAKLDNEEDDDGFDEELEESISEEDPTISMEIGFANQFAEKY